MRTTTTGRRYPGSDPAGGRFAHEPRAARRVEDEDDDEGDLGENEEQALDALEALRPRELALREVVVDVDVRARQIRGHGARPPERDAADPDR